MSAVTTPAERLVILAKGLAPAIAADVLSIHAAEVELLKRSLSIPFATIADQLQVFAECMRIVRGEA